MKPRIFLLLFLFCGSLEAMESFSLVHAPANIPSPYSVAFVRYEGGEARVLNGQVDLPDIISGEYDSNGSSGFDSIKLRGLPLHLPVSNVGVGEAWEGFGTIESMISHHKYRLVSFKTVAGRECAEIDYEVRLVPGDQAGGGGLTAQDMTGEGRFLFDIKKGFVLLHTWQLRGGGHRFEYAAVVGDI